jgi:predicted DCC family thiol-disulfide oxidoreductase YuxK
LAIGYKSKISHFIVAIIIIGIHSQVTEVANSGDMFLTSMLVWTLFLPLGKSLSVDALIKSLKKFRELKVEDLNNREKGINKPVQIKSIAYFAALLQISAIYFLSALNRIGSPPWEKGTAFYDMHQLDTFITSFGYYIRDYINYPISKFFTYSSLYLEYSIPFLLLFPFYKHILRFIAVITLTIFHIMINLSINVGLFSPIMIATFPLLIDIKIINCMKTKILNRYNNKFNLFYDSDCGFCHYSVRIIKRLDILNRIIFCDANSKVKKPKIFNELSDKTAILYNPKTDIIWTRHKAFGKILSLLPFGFFISWILFIPIISEFFGLVYDQIAKNRTKISTFFGLPACNIPQNDNEETQKNNTSQKSFIYIHFRSLFKLTAPLIIIVMLSASIYSALLEINVINDHNWRNIKTLKKINGFARMNQNWVMFKRVPGDEVIIVEVTLDNGEKINPFTGEKAELKSTDYKILMNNKSQLWRKYFEDLFGKYDNKKNINLKYKNNFKNWILDSNNTYFNENLKKNKIQDVEIWKVYHNQPKIDNEKYGQGVSVVYKKLEERLYGGNKTEKNKSNIKKEKNKSNTQKNKNRKIKKIK